MNLIQIANTVWYPIPMLLPNVNCECLVTLPDGNVEFADFYLEGYNDNEFVVACTVVHPIAWAYKPEAYIKD